MPVGIHGLSVGVVQLPALSWYCRVAQYRALQTARWAGLDRASPRRDPGYAGISRATSLDSGSGANSQKSAPRADFVLRHARPLTPPIQSGRAARSNSARPRPAHHAFEEDDRTKSWEAEAIGFAMASSRGMWMELTLISVRSRFNQNWPYPEAMPRGHHCPIKIYRSACSTISR